MRKFYSEDLPEILNKEARLKKAKQIYSILVDYLGETKKLELLDYGCSSGVITNYLSKHFKKTIGVDVDAHAIREGKKDYKNVVFEILKDEKLKFPKDTFDVVICNQVYNFVQSPQKMINEIYRVLKPGGICFFGARNRLQLIEPQYKIPFASIFPKFLPQGKNYKTYWGLKDLTKKFNNIDYTEKILSNPSKYKFSDVKSFKIVLKILPYSLIKYFIPNYIWLLRK